MAVQPSPFPNHLPDDLDEVSEFYQRRAHFDHLISLLESGIGLERAHMGIFTELGILYAKFRPEKLMEHLKLFSKRLNIPRLIRATEEQEMWKELTYLYIQVGSVTHHVAVEELRVV